VAVAAAHRRCVRARCWHLTKSSAPSRAFSLHLLVRAALQAGCTGSSCHNAKPACTTLRIALAPLTPVPYVQSALTRIYNSAFSSFFTRTPRNTDNSDAGAAAQSSSQHGPPAQVSGERARDDNAPVIVPGVGSRGGGRAIPATVAATASSRSTPATPDVSGAQPEAAPDGAEAAVPSEGAPPAAAAQGASAPAGEPLPLDTTSGFMGILRKSMSMRPTARPEAPTPFPAVPRASGAMGGSGADGPGCAAWLQSRDAAGNGGDSKGNSRRWAASGVLTDSMNIDQNFDGAASSEDEVWAILTTVQKRLRAYSLLV
jgi:hypothetical protein